MTLLVGGLLAGCSAAAGTPTDEGTPQSSAPRAEESAPALTVADALTANLPTHDGAADAEWDAATEVQVDLADGASTASGEGVSIDGDTVTIDRAGTYRLSGALTDGEVVVDAADGGVVRLVLDGVDVASTASSPLAVVEAGTAVVVLADGSENRLADAARTVEDGSDEPDAGLYSAADLTITGTGALEVQGRTNDGIATKDGLVVNGGTITVDAVDDAIRGKDYLVVNDGEIVATAEGDGLKSDNDEDAAAGYVALLGGTVSIEAGADGVDAATDVIVGDGTLDVRSGGGSSATVAEDDSAKGLKAGVAVVVGGGTATVDSADDAVHSNGDVAVTGGELTLASGDDGVHAEGSVTVTDGTVSVTDSYEGIEAPAISVTGGDVTLVSSDDGVNAAGDETSSYSLTVTGGTVSIEAGGDGLDSNGTVDMSGGTVMVSGPADPGNGSIDVVGEFTISGGTLVAAGSAGMAMAPGTDSPQASVMTTVPSQRAGTVVQVVSSDGDAVASFTPRTSFSSVVLSAPGLVAGETYEVYVGGSVAGTQTGGVHDDGDLAGASVVATVTAGEYASGGMGGPGGGEPGGMGEPGGGRGAAGSGGRGGPAF
ncbi:carbohydrate-binding domain-containing protein [Georgenia faecalis]|uniref:carbohydrate-binding domain-containing protein n=1 Tax=Georgenia faecalis TaxID=2483799 RepID=UPI001F49A27A|nr:carbohydrate-binding domain-containing protein [Georgenia faecalis]